MAYLINISVIDMKKVFIYIFSILLCSCDRLEDFDPPYNNLWWIKNCSSQELVVFANRNCVDLEGQVFDGEIEFSLPIGDSCYVYSNFDNLSKEELFSLMTTNVNYVKIMNSDKSVLFGAFYKNTSSVEHNPYNESEWKYVEFTKQITSDYFQTFKWWTFTITDADIGLEE